MNRTWLNPRAKRQASGNTVVDDDPYAIARLAPHGPLDHAAPHPTVRVQDETDALPSVIGLMPNGRAGKTLR